MAKRNFKGGRWGDSITKWKVEYRGKGSKTWKRGTGNKKMSKQKAIYQN